MRRAAVGLLTLISVGACGARTELRPDSAQSGGARNVSGSPGAGGLASLGGSTGQGGASGGTTSRGGAPPRVEFHCDVAPNDPRVAGIRPHEVATLDADWFVTGPVRTYRWTLVNEDCDAIVPNTESRRLPIMRSRVSSDTCSTVSRVASSNSDPRVHRTIRSSSRSRALTVRTRPAW